ncbi:neuromedin Bb [Hoplias malabaricus]|uniref:neuromedin Bb n=1 Tax=Hoplias malabaricus TaxID=27720 RepID=UPI00346294FF
MSGLSLYSFCQFGLFTYLVLFSFISKTSSVSLDLTELRNKVAKIKVNPRGNLWATGHFMGKKSVVDSLFPPDGGALNPLQVGADDLYQEVLKTALQARLQSSDNSSKNEDTEVFMKILENYIQGKRKW